VVGQPWFPGWREHNRIEPGQKKVRVLDIVDPKSGDAEVNFWRRHSATYLGHDQSFKK
jgi:hypothetical protein